jgi:hypothetical protein
MDPVLTLTIVGLVLLSILRYAKHHICISCMKRGKNIISFIVGATIVVIFTELLNDIYSEVHRFNDLLILLVPIAFTASMYVERHIDHHKDHHEKEMEMELLTKNLSFFSGLVGGLLITNMEHKSLLSLTVFLVVIFAYDIIRGVSYHIIYEKHEAKHKKFLAELKNIALAAAPLYGFALARTFPVPELLQIVLISIFGGFLLHILLKEVVLPHAKKSCPRSFAAGFILFLLIFFWQHTYM